MELAEHSPSLAMLASIEAFMRYGQPEKAEQMIREMFNMQRQEEAQTEVAENEALPEPPETEPPPPVVVGEGGI